MSTRRGFLGFLAGLFAVPGVASAKAVISDPSALLVVELGPEFLDPDDERIARLEACFVEKLKGTSFGRPIFVSAGIKIKALPGGGVYHREKVGNVELEIVAKTEEEMKKRLDELGYFDNRPAPNELRAVQNRKPFATSTDGFGYIENLGGDA